MSTWTKEELDAIAKDEDLYISIPNPDGTMHEPTRIWVVQAGNDLYARPYAGVGGRWYIAAKAAGQGHISIGDVDKDVSFEFPTDDETNDAVDEGYETKYAGSPYVEPMIGDEQRLATVKFVPIE